MSLVKVGTTSCISRTAPIYGIEAEDFDPATDRGFLVAAGARISVQNSFVTIVDKTKVHAGGYMA